MIYSGLSPRYLMLFKGKPLTMAVFSRQIKLVKDVAESNIFDVQSTRKRKTNIVGMALSDMRAVSAHVRLKAFVKILVFFQNFEQGIGIRPIPCSKFLDIPKNLFPKRFFGVAWGKPHTNHFNTF